MSYLNWEEDNKSTVDPKWFDKAAATMGDSSHQFDIEPIKREAGGSNEQVARSVHDVSWAGSATINEEFEIERHLKEHIERGTPYPAIEKALIAYGYPKNRIRRGFHRLTKVDPVQAYLDLSTYTVPPDAVPRYNYGWGPAKDKDADYYFILPYIQRYAIFKQIGLDRSVVFDHMSLTATQEELSKYVKDVRAVTPDTLDNVTDIIQRVASIQTPHYESEAANKLAEMVIQMRRIGGLADAEKAIKMAYADEAITKAEHDSLIERLAADDPTEQSGEEKLKQRELEKYQKEQETRTIDDETTSIKIPQEDFQNKIEDSNKVNMAELSQDAYSLLEDISSSVPGFTIEPRGQVVDLIDVQNYQEDDTNHIDAGSIRFLVQLTDLKSGGSKKGLVIMFIVNGKLQYSGKFKGEDNREYALSTPGINAYFDSTETIPVDELHYTPQAVPTSESTSPYK